MSSPTAIICTTIGGNTWCSASGAARDSPRPYTLLDGGAASRMTTLPAVSPTMSRLWRIGTPAESIVPRLRVKRLMATFWNSWPKTGIRSFIGSTT